MAIYAGRYDEVLIRRLGNRPAFPPSGTTVLVYESDGSTEASLYTSRTKAVAADNPVSVDASGNLEFFADPGTYVLSISEDGSEVATNTVVIHADPADETHSASTVVLTASGDTTGATDADAITAAIAEVSANGGTVELATGGPWYIDQQITVPQGVNLWGQGGGQIHAATTIVCTDAAAGIAFGTRTTGGRGGVSGNFLVDGDDIATQPLYVGMTVHRTFIGMESSHSAGHGLVVEAAQNNTFIGTVIDYAADAGLVVDYGAAGNHFLNLECDTNTTWHVIFRQSGASPAGLNDKPYGNQVWGGILERGVQNGVVKNTAGEANALHGVQIVHDENIASFDLVLVEDGYLTIDGGVVQANNAGQGTAFHVTGGKLTVTGEPIVVAVGTVFDNAGTIDLPTMIHAVGYTTWLSGTAPNEPTSYTEAGLGTIPIFAAGSAVHDTAVAAVSGSWWRLDPDGWQTPPEGRTLQYRLHMLTHNATAGDVVGAYLYVPADGAGLSGEVTATVSADGAAEVVTPWADFPAAAKTGYVMARNQTAARGVQGAAFIEVRIA